MLYENGVYLWLALFLTLLVCEIFVLYRVKMAVSFMIGCVACIVFSEYEKSLFVQCVFFLGVSCAVFSVLTFLAFLQKRTKDKNSDKLVDVITLCDIPNKEYGYVYHSGKSYTLKNDSGDNLKKGDVLQVSWQALGKADV